MSLPPSRRHPQPFGKYLLLDRINIGGMAEVWRGKVFGAGGFERLMAIKRILPNIAEDVEFISMFIDEAKITVQLAHSNIAQIYELNRIGSSYYIAMEYISGKDLRVIFDRCRAAGQPAPVPLSCYVVAKVCEGLDYAHRKKDGTGREMNIVHRDVSPQNVLVSYEGEVKVIDFGIAFAASKATQTQAGTLKGKFGYMSPEQIRGSAIDRRADVFAAGIILYEMLTGERLFVGDSDFAVLEKVRALDIAPPSKLNPQVPAALDQIVMRALSREVEPRYPYASELADALQRFLLGSQLNFSRKELSAYMKSTFAEELEAEKQRLKDYEEVRPVPGMDVSGESGFESLGPATPLLISEPASMEPTSLAPLGGLAVIEAPTALARDDDTARSQSLTQFPRLTAVAPLLTNPAEEGTWASLKPRGEVPPLVPAPKVSAPNADEAEVLPATVMAHSPLSSPVALWPSRLASAPLRVLLLGGLGAVGLVCLTALIIAFKPPPSGLLLLEAPLDLRGKVEVHINGEPIVEPDGSPPSTWPLVRKVPAGSATVVVTAEGHESFHQVVPVEAGGNVSTVRVGLGPSLSEVPVRLKVTPPSARVTLNDLLLREQVGPGAYETQLDARVESVLRVTAPGYAPYRKVLRFERAEPLSLPIELQPLEFLAMVRSEPEGATVVVGGAPRGETPTSLMVSPAVRHVSLKKRCYRSTAIPITFPTTSDQVISLNARLRRLPGCR